MKPATTHPSLALAAAALMLLMMLPAVPGSEAATTRSLAITSATANPTVAFKGFDGNPPKVYDINGDGKLEIIAQNDNQWVYVFDSKTGKILFEAKTRFPSGWGARSFNGPEVAVLSEGGAVRLVVANSAAFVTVYKFEASTSSSSRFVFTKEWDRRLTDCHSNPGMDAKPVLADLDLDGRMEILAATEESGVYALRSDGTLLWKRCIGGGNAEPTVADLNMNGWPDVVFPSDGGTITAMDGRTGGTLWTYWVPGAFNVGTGSMPVGAAVAQLDGKGGPDVVVGVRDSHDANDNSKNHALLLALDHAGRLLWGRQDPTGNSLTYTHPVVVDADGDGQREVYWADWNTNGHKPPWDESKAWQVTGPGNFYRYDAAGTRVWKRSLDTWWSNKDLAIADVDADGVQEVLANGPNGGHDGIWYLDVRTGAKEAFVDVHPYKVMRAPVVADLWDTGTMQWVIQVGPAAAGGADGILVYDTKAPWSAAYPHLPYPILGGGGAPSGTFDATFRIKAPNEWWQELYVEPDTARTIVAAEVRIDGGAWKPMQKSSWGAWTSSYNAPKGVPVEFLATDGGNRESRSEPFTWLDGTTTRRSTTGGGGDPLTAQFQVAPGVNEWWVEVDVTANQPLSAVHASVNGGPWTALSPTDWGTWAKSFHVAKGSKVQFRATATTGDAALSQTYTWLSSGSTFDATFEPRAQENPWWVEAKVTATRPVVKVEAKVNSGSWTALSPTDWGTWAKSIHAPSGSTVTFRATDGDGQTDTSAAYPWGG